MGLQDWWADRIDTAFFNQLGGNTGQSDTKYTGNQAAIAPTSTHYITSSEVGGEGSLTATTTAYFSVSDIDRCVAIAKTHSPMIRPIRIDGGDYYVLFIHPYTTYQLRQQAATAGSWADIQKAAIQGGQTTGNPIFNGALGMWNGVIIHESTRVPNIVSTPADSSVGAFSRAIFGGAQAACLAFGKNSGPGKMSWVEDTFDYGNQLGVSAGMIWGLKKTQFNSADFSTIVCANYAPPITAS
jgi:N4-gp56 family major capsid protein